MDLGKGFDSSKYGDLSHSEVVLIIKLSSMLCSLEEIQTKFREFSNNTKNIPGKIVLEIQADFSKRIQKEADIYLKNVEGSPFSHPRLVLDMYLEIYKDARVPRPKQTFRTGPEEWEVSSEADNRCALNAVDSATKYLREGEKIQLDKLKRNQALLPSTLIEDKPPEEVPAEEVPTVWKME